MYRTIAKEALERWSAARRLERTSPAGSPAWKRAILEEQKTEREYQNAIQGAIRKHLPEPPPFDEARAADPDEDPSPA